MSHLHDISIWPNQTTESDYKVWYLISYLKKGMGVMYVIFVCFHSFITIATSYLFMHAWNSSHPKYKTSDDTFSKFEQICTLHSISHCHQDVSHNYHNSNNFLLYCTVYVMGAMTKYCNCQYICFLSGAAGPTRAVGWMFLRNPDNWHNMFYLLNV